jgi:hypothetical protein
MARKYRARSISSAIVRSDRGSCQWSMPSFILAVQGNVLWWQGQRDQHREITMAPCSGSKAAIVLRPAVRESRPATKKAAPGVRLERPGRTGTHRSAGTINHVGGYNVVSEWPRPDRGCGGYIDPIAGASPADRRDDGGPGDWTDCALIAAASSTVRGLPDAFPSCEPASRISSGSLEAARGSIAGR